MTDSDIQKFLPPSAAETAFNQVWARIPATDDRQAEPIAAYEAFLLYCGLPFRNPPERRSLANLIRLGLVSVKQRQLENYSANFDWQRRAFAYDDYISKLEQNAKEVARFRSIKKWNDRREVVRNNEWNDAQELRKKAKEFLELPLIETKIIKEEISDDGKTIVQHITQVPLRAALSDVVRMIETADKLERNAVDAETDRIIIESVESKRQSDVLKARASFAKSAELFPNSSEAERAQSIARAFNVSVNEILVPDELVSSVVQETVSSLPN